VIHLTRIYGETAAHGMGGGGCKWKLQDLHEENYDYSRMKKAHRLNRLYIGQSFRGALLDFLYFSFVKCFTIAATHKWGSQIISGTEKGAPE